MTAVAAGALGQYLKVQLLAYPEDYTRSVNWTGSNQLLPQSWPHLFVDREDRSNDSQDARRGEFDARENSDEEPAGNYYVDDSRERQENADSYKRQRLRQDDNNYDDMFNMYADAQHVRPNGAGAGGSEEATRRIVVDVNDDDGGDVYHEAEAWRDTIAESKRQNQVVTVAVQRDTDDAHAANVYQRRAERPPGSLSIEASYFVVFVIMVTLMAIMYRLVRNRRIHISYRF